MEKKLVHEYTFDASAKTITSNEFTDINKIALITNVTDNIIIYNFADAAKGGTISGNVITLDYDTTTMSDTDELQIILHVGTDLDRIGFAKAITNNVDTDFFTLVQTGSGMTVNQTGGNLVITTGTTARSETLIRSNKAFTGGIRLRAQTVLSQRIANQQFFVELVDVVGDGLAYSIGSATAVTVTFPASFGLSSQNVGQSMTLCCFSGTGTFFSGRYPIASVSGNDATFTVSGFAAGTGTVSVVGWNFYKLEYTSTTATNAIFDTGRKGYSSGNTTATISTTASPGHMAIITGNDGIASLHDQLVASATAIQTSNRANRTVMVPDDAFLRLQIRVVNGTTAPASTTTWTIGQVSVGSFEAESVIVQDVRPTGYGTAIPVEVMRSSTHAVTMTSTTLTAVTPGTAATNLGKARDSAIGATDTGVAILGVRRDTPTAETPVAGDYVVPQVSAFGEQWVRLGGELADDAAFTPGTTRVVPVGFMVDDTATDSVDEGDAGAPRMSADRVIYVQGATAHDAADAGNPLKIGGKAIQSNPTAVADGDRANLVLDDLGRVVSSDSHVRDLVVQQVTTITSSTSETTILTAGAAGVFHDVKSIMIANKSASATLVTVRDATAGSAVAYIHCPAGDTRGVVFNTPFKQTTAANNWTAQCGTSVDSVYITVQAVKNV